MPGARPRPVNSASSDMARASDSLSLYSCVPTVSVWPVMTISATLRREISANTRSKSAWDFRHHLVAVILEIQLVAGGRDGPRRQHVGEILVHVLLAADAGLAVARRRRGIGPVQHHLFCRRSPPPRRRYGRRRPAAPPPGRANSPPQTPPPAVQRRARGGSSAFAVGADDKFGAAHTQQRHRRLDVHGLGRLLHDLSDLTASVPFCSEVLKTPSWVVVSKRNWSSASWLPGPNDIMLLSAKVIPTVPLAVTMVSDWKT